MTQQREDGARGACGEVRQSEAIALLRSLPDASVPMIFADPPYGIGYHSNHHVGKNPHAPVANDWNFNIGSFLRESGRVLVDGGALYLCCRWDVSPLWLRELTPPLKMKSAIAWVKDNHSAGDLTGSFGNKYEQVLFITKGRHKLRGKRWSNVWEFPRVTAKAAVHPTQKPIELVARAIGASSDHGDLVIDPFSGSGTTALACVQTGRRYLVGDIDEQMVRLTRSRLGLWTDEAPLERSETPSPPIDYSLQVEHQFGAPADDLAFIVDALQGGAA